jgi:oxygen-independent coproporphyrinogen-3 oxidase
MIDFEKFEKYSKPGPRYTSYPTAVEFTEEFKYEKYIQKLISSHRKLSLYFHLPFCRSACYFCGCNVVFTSKTEKMQEYIFYLFKEMEILKKNIDTKREVVQLHFGGGTPTFFSPSMLEEIISQIHLTFENFSGGLPFSELSRPTPCILSINFSADLKVSIASDSLRCLKKHMIS